MTEHDPSFDDNAELELEPLDPEILKHQQERAKRKTREAEDSVDINAAFDSVDLDDPIDLEQLKKLRFTTRHLLIATALLAIMMTLVIQLGFFMSLFVAGCTALAGGWWYVARAERLRLEQAEAERERFQQQLAARRAAEDGQPPSGTTAQHTGAASTGEPQPGFRFAFSMQQLLIAFTAAAVFLGLAVLIGGQSAVLLLGLVALAGLLVQAVGIELPPLLVLGWWILLVLYIVVSLWGAFTPAPPA